MALDAQGRAVQRMRTFTHLMPGEVQGCIGCHDHRLHSARGQLGTAYYNREPKNLAPPEWFIEAEVTKQEFVLDGKDAAGNATRMLEEVRRHVK